MSDVDRLKRWIDLTADVLTESAGPDDSVERTFLRQQVRDGVDELDRGDTVDGEAAFDRILEHRRKVRKVSR